MPLSLLLLMMVRYDASRIIDDINQPVPIATNDNDDGDDDGMEGEQATVSKQPNKYSFTPLFQNSVLHMMTSLCHRSFIVSSNSLRYFFFLPLFIHSFLFFRKHNGRRATLAAASFLWNDRTQGYA